MRSLKVHGGLKKNTYIGPLNNPYVFYLFIKTFYFQDKRTNFKNYQENGKIRLQNYFGWTEI